MNVELQLEDKLTTRLTTNLIGLLPAPIWFKKRKATTCSPCFTKILTKEKDRNSPKNQIMKVKTVKNWQSADARNSHP